MFYNRVHSNVIESFNENINMSFYIKKKENFKVFKFFTVHIHNPQQQHLFPYFFFFADEVEQFEIRAEKEGKRTERDGRRGGGKRWLTRQTERTERDGQLTDSEDCGPKDQRLWNVHLVAHGHGRQNQAVFWPGLPGKVPALSSIFLQGPRTPAILLTCPPSNNQDAKNEKLFATHTQIFL